MNLIKYYQITGSIIYKFLTKEEIDFFINMDNINIKHNLAIYSNLSKEQIGLFINMNNFRINDNLLQNENIPLEIKEKIVNDTIKKEIFK